MKRLITDYVSSHVNGSTQAQAFRPAIFSAYLSWPVGIRDRQLLLKIIIKRERNFLQVYCWHQEFKRGFECCLSKSTPRPVGYTISRKTERWSQENTSISDTYIRTVNVGLLHSIKIIRYFINLPFDDNHAAVLNALIFIVIQGSHPLRLPFNMLHFDLNHGSIISLKSVCDFQIIQLISSKMTCL